MTAPEDLLERIQLRLDESFVGIGEVVADLPPRRRRRPRQPARRCRRPPRSSACSRSPRAIEVFDQPTLQRRSAILEKLEPGARRPDPGGRSRPTSAPTSCAAMGEHGAPAPAAQAHAPRCAPRWSGCCGTPTHTAGGIMTTEFVRLDPEHDGRRGAEAHPLGGPREGVDLRLLRPRARDRAAAGLGLAARPGDGGAGRSRSTDGDAPASRSPWAPSTTRRRSPRKIAKYNLLAVPVLEKDGSVVGFVTVDDVIDVMIEEGTEDVLKMAAVEAGALDKPYLATPFWALVRKRAGWLLLLFLGEMLTATAMGHYEEEIARAVVLALFVPAHHQQRRQLRLAGRLADHPRPGGGRAPRPRLVAGDAARAPGGPRARRHPRLRRASCASRSGRSSRPRPTARTGRSSRSRSGCRSSASCCGARCRLDAAARAQAARHRPGRLVGAVRGDARRRDRHRHLLRGGGAGAAGDAALRAAPGRGYPASVHCVRVPAHKRPIRERPHRHGRRRPSSVRATGRITPGTTSCSEQTRGQPGGAEPRGPLRGASRAARSPKRQGPAATRELPGPLGGQCHASRESRGVSAGGRPGQRGDVGLRQLEPVTGADEQPIGGASRAPRRAPRARARGVSGGTGRELAVRRERLGGGVVGTSVSTVVDEDGQFVLTQVPSGTVTVKLEGGGVDAQVTVNGLWTGR